MDLRLEAPASQSGPSLVAHWKPWIKLSLLWFRRLLFTSGIGRRGLRHGASVGKLSSKSTLGPFNSGPKAHTDLEANKSWQLKLRHPLRPVPIVVLGEEVA